MGDACVTLAGFARLVCKEALAPGAWGSGERTMSVKEAYDRFAAANVTVPGKKVKFDFGDEERAGLELFYRYAAETGVVPDAGQVRFY